MNTIDEHNPVAEARACASCGLPADPSKTTALCAACRQKFIAFPVPLWIKVFGGVLLCVLLFSLLTLSKNIQTGIHYKRGVKAMEEKNFLTAEKELQTVLAKEPTYLDARCQLLIASFYNNHLNTFFETSESLQNKSIEDTELFGRMQHLAEKAAGYFPKDSFVTIMQQYAMESDSIPEAVYKTYLAAYPDDHFAATRLAHVLSLQNRYGEEDSLLNLVLQKEPGYYSALILKTSSKREQKQFDSSYRYIAEMLKLNRQDVSALASKVRTLLKEKKDKEALALARQTTELDGSDVYALSTMAMAYHFNNDAKARDRIVQKLEKDTAATGSLVYVRNIISGKEQFRN